jgi:hypothetical protein
MSFFDDVIRRDPRFHSAIAIRDPGLLEPTFRALVTDIITEAADAGHTLMILETYRSQELQAIYFERGVTQLRTVGVHHYGLACDLGIVVAGQVNWKADYSILGTLAERHKLVWGGNWGEPTRPHSFRDYDHIQRIAVEDQVRLFAGGWYPDSTYQLPTGVV